MMKNKPTRLYNNKLLKLLPEKWRKQFLKLLRLLWMKDEMTKFQLMNYGIIFKEKILILPTET